VPRRRSAWFALALVYSAAGPLLAPSTARADFSAEGRKKRGVTPKPAPKGPAAPGGTAGKPGAPGGTAGKPAARPEAAASGGEGAEKGPGREALIARYMGIVLAQPGAAFPLQRLSQLYRERDGNVQGLVDEFTKRARAGGAEAWAAKVALAGLLKQEGKTAEALKAYEAAVAERPKEASTLLALAQALRESGDLPGARARYEEALKHLSAQADKEQTLRTLMALALEANDGPGAKGYHKQLVTLTGGSLFVRAELGRELLGRGKFAEAEAEFEEVVKAAAGDNRALGPALRDLGLAQAKQKKNAAALATLKRALAAAGGEAGVRNEILAGIAEVYRADGNLPALVALLEKENPGDFPRLVMLGSLYEETGAVDKAVATFRRALGVNGKHIETRLRLVRLLQAQGELDQAVVENERLIDAAPRNPEFVFQLCETLLQRGDRARALGHLAKLEQGAAGDEDVLARVADFYERIDEKDRAMRLLTRLAQLAPGDPTHLVELGDRYWQAGDKKKAQEVWSRIRTAVGNKAKALSALGEVLLEHDLTGEALAAFKEASEAEPGNLRYRKGYALALERAAPGAGTPALSQNRFDEARAVWEEVLAKSGGDRLLAREARTHVVTLWGLLKQLEQRAEPLRRRLGDEPPDLEAGRLLAEVQLRLRRLPEAEATLQKILSKAPGDEEAYLSLERVRVMGQNLPGAIAVLEKLADLNPKRAREYYQRMAQYAAELYRDDDAIAYAAKAVALGPEDADGHRKLGEMYRRRGDNERAAAEFRQALSKNDRLYAVYMQLAEILSAKGEGDEADRLHRRVVRATPDDELVMQAGRLSMQRHAVKASLGELETELLPLALGHPTRPVFRRLLVELYGQMTFPLVQQARLGTPDEAERARLALRKVGERGVKPLLDALGDEQKSQGNIALEVLAYVATRGAGPALMAYATGPSEQSMRVRAMVAAGALRDPALLPRYEALLAPKDGDAVAPGDPVTVAAAWGVARMGDRRALPLLARMLDSASPDVRAFGALGYGLSKDRGAPQKLEALLASPDVTSSNLRAAAALGLGEAGARGSAPALLALATGPDPFVRSAAYVALARLGDASAAPAIAPALFAVDAHERQAAAAALVSLHAKDPLRPAEPLPVQGGVVEVREALKGLFLRPPSAQARVQTLVAQADVIARAASSAASASPERASAVAEALSSGRSSPGRAALAPLLEGGEELADADRRAVAQAVAAVERAAAPHFASLARHPSSAVRVRALELLGGHDDDGAAAAIAEALRDDDEAVVRAALEAAERTPKAKAGAQIVRLLASSPRWAVRVAAAKALGNVARYDAAEVPNAQRALASAARGDGFAFVREAALEALARLDPASAQRAAADVAARDADPQLRQRAAEWAKTWR
jgi:tetratricopeptide (TPR) repeat protein/HEAT repeat protein